MRNMMRKKTLVRVLAAAWALALTGSAVLAVVFTVAAPARAQGTGTVVCTNNPCIIQAANAGNGDSFDGLVVQGAAGLNHAFMVRDPGKAPIIWTEPGAVATGDVPVCPKSANLSFRVCISPGTYDPSTGQFTGPGLLQLWACDTCSPVTIDPEFVQDVQQLEAKFGL